MAGRPGSPSAPIVDPWAPVLRTVAAGLSGALGTLQIHLSPEELLGGLDDAGGEGWDIAYPVHRVAKSAGRPPDALAASLAGTLGPLAEVSAIEAVGGFVNFTIDPDPLCRRTLASVAERAAAYGSLEAAMEAVCVEHTSANPTGPFHIGRVRNGLIGDTLARVLRAAGAPVTAQYYVDDVGRQAAMITWIWAQPPESWPEEIRPFAPSNEGDRTARPDRYFGQPYPAVSSYLKEHPEAREEVAELSRRLEAGTAPAGHHEHAEAILRGMLASLARLGIRFDEFVWESTFLADGSVERVVDRLAAAPHARRQDNGALSIDARGYGLPQEKAEILVTRGDGTSLYVTRDIAYHLAKFRRFPRCIDVLGQDHRLHARTLEALLNELGESRRPEFVIYQDITVPEGGRMSTRKGSAVWLDDLLDEATERARGEVLTRREDLTDAEVDQIAERVASGAVRYQIVRVAPEKAVPFRWEEALSFEGRSGPFVQYAYARASSLLRKAEPDRAPFPYDPARLRTPEERALVSTIARLPRTVGYVARSAHVHSLAGYAHALADRFNRFYQTLPVLSSGPERSSRLALVAATRQCLGNTLELLGIDRLERM